MLINASAIPVDAMSCHTRLSHGRGAVAAKRRGPVK